MARKTSPTRVEDPVRSNGSSFDSKPTEHRPEGERPSLPIEEIAACYPGEWVAVKVAQLDDRQRITHGRVLAHSKARKRISDALLHAHQEDPAAHTYVFVGGAQPRTADEWRERLAAAAGAVKDYRDAWW